MPDHGYDRSANTTHLYPGRITHLYQSQLYLYPNATYTLDIVLEQDPLKLFPVRDMTTADQRELWRVETGKLPRFMLPFLAQARGVWKLDASGGGPGKYAHYFSNVPKTPDDGDLYSIQAGEGWAPARGGSIYKSDYWRATRAFYATVYIYVEDDLKATVTPPTLTSPDSTIVQHRGWAQWPPLVYNDAGLAGPDFDFHRYPQEVICAYARQITNNLVAVADRNKGNRVYSGGGAGYSYRVEYTGLGKVIVNVVTVGKQSRVRFAVTQLPCKVPADYGITEGSEIEWRDDSFGAPTDHQWTVADPVGARAGNDRQQGYAYAFGGTYPAARTEFADAWGGSLQNAGDHCYTFASSASVNTAGIDVPATGLGGTPQYGVLGYTRYHFSTSAGGSDWVAAVSSPLLIGADKQGWDDDLAIASGLDPLGHTYQTEASIHSGEADATSHPHFDRYRDLALSRRDYCRPYMPAKIKATVTLTRSGPDVGDVITSYVYTDLPVEQGPLRQVSLDEWVPYRHADMDTYTDMGLTRTYDEREGVDLYASWTIGAGQKTFECMANVDGLHIADVTSEVSTLGPLYEDLDTYIYDYTDAETYEEYVDRKDAAGEEIP